MRLFLDRSFLFARVHPRRAYVVAGRSGAIVPVDGMFIAAGGAPHSIRTARAEPGRLLLVGGEGHATGRGGDTGERYRRLEQWATERLALEAVERRWSTQDGRSVDGLPFVGRLGRVLGDVWVATGFDGWGMSNGTMAAALIADGLAGRGCSWARLYDPNRLRPLAAAGPLLRENAAVARELVGGLLRVRDGAGPLAPGEARVVRSGGRRVALHRRPDGELLAVSAACTHMGCTVAWNEAEETWDCPGHGSRFLVDGRVVEGPAVRPLEPVEPPPALALEPRAGRAARPVNRLRSGAVGGSANVTARLQAGDADLVDALVDTAQCLVCILDPKGRIVRFNELCERATGYAEAEVLGRDIRELFIPPEHVETFSELLKLVWTTHTPSPRAGEWLTRDGGRFPVVWSNRPLTDAEGRPRLFVSAGVDLSGRDVLHTQLEEQLELTNRLAEEQAALRRVATLVASGPEPGEVFRAVSAEAAGLMAADAAGVLRFDRDEVASVVGRHELAELVAFPVGGAIALDEDSAVARVFRTGSTSKIDAYEGIESEVGQRMRRLGITSSVAAPIYLHNRLWGAIVVSTRAGTPPEAWVERRLGEFAEMVSLALAGADNRRQLLESRERIVRASDDERRRLERNLHDGAQQRLVGLAILLRLARTRLEEGERPSELIEKACEEVEAAIEDLRALAQGLHPPLLTQAGVGIALRAVGRRLPLTVEVEDDGERFAPEVEAALYYVAAEALTNTVKHAAAETAGIRLARDDQEVVLRVADDGRGGAVEGSDGSGLRGLRDRVEALRGSFDVASPPGAGTTISVRLPLREDED